MAYKSELFTLVGGNMLALSYEEVRPSSLVIPRKIAVLAFHSTVELEPGETDAGVIIPDAAEVMMFGHPNKHSLGTTEQHEPLEWAEVESLGELVDYTVGKSKAIIEQGCDTLMMQVNASDITPEQLDGMHQIGERLRHVAEGAAHVPEPQMSFDEPQLHVGMYL